MDLSLVETDLLLKTLLERYEHAIFMGVKIPIKNKDNTGEIFSTRRWYGNSYTCAGLCADLSTSILRDFKDREIIDERE